MQIDVKRCTVLRQRLGCCKTNVILTFSENSFCPFNIGGLGRTLGEFFKTLSDWHENCNYNKITATILLEAATAASINTL